MVVNMISIREVDISLKFETILLIGALLIGGNQKAQEKFLEILQKDTNNSFMRSFEKIIDQLYLISKKTMQNLQKKRFSESILKQ
jgi:hypothetical protein